MCIAYKNTDNDKIFIVKRSQIEGRLDPKMLLYNRKVKHSIYPRVKLKNILIGKPQYGANEPGTPRIDNDEPRYIRITDVNEYGLIDNNDMGATVNTVDTQYILNYNDILLARSGATVGKAYIHKYSPYECLYAGYLIRFVIDERKALPDYVFAYTQLDTYKEWVNAIQRPSAQPNINAEEYQSLEIPLPDKNKQKLVVDIIRNAYELRRQKETAVQQFLNSIDEYILSELGIFLPEIKTDLDSRTFFVNRSDLEERLDPTVYKDGMKLISSCFENIRLSSIAIINPGGAYNGKAIETAISFVPMDVIDEEYSEITSCGETTIADSSGFSKFKEGDLLWAKITPCMQNGKSAIARNLKNGLGCGSTEFFVIRPKDKRVTVEYLHVILHMKCVRENAKLYFGGSAGQQRVSLSFFENFSLPLPSITKQMEMANKVYALRQQAKQMYEEGKLILENAKKEIERIIIG